MTKAAILIDGGYFLKRLPAVRTDIDTTDASAVAQAVDQLIRGHLHQLNDVHRVENYFQLLYRCFYYDARPYDRRAHSPITKRAFNYAKSPEAIFRTALFDTLNGLPNLAVRLGHVHKDSDRSWILKSESQKRLLDHSLAVNDLTDDDFSPALRQKGVDMRIGLDIASITLKRQANVIILVAGDADFVPAAKLARREGVHFILDPLWRNVSMSALIFPVLEASFHLRNRITWERDKGRGAKRNWKNNTEDIWFCTRSEEYYFDVDAVKLKRKVLAPYRAHGKPKDWSEEQDGKFRLTHPSNIWTDITVPFWSMPENTDHPTQKPEKLMAKLILASSRPGDYVFDPFLGSGTTAVVAEKLSRRWCGVEIDAEYQCLALKRLAAARTDPSIQGYADGVFRERNALSGRTRRVENDSDNGQPGLFS